MRAAALLLGLILFGCRDVTQPFASDDRPAIESAPVRLTYSLGDDRSPTWSNGSDSVYYSASASEYEPDSEGVLMTIARAGGTATPLLAAQPGRALPGRLLEPAARTTTAELAFVELRGTHPPQPCAFEFLTCTVATAPLPSPRLMEAWLSTTDSADAPDWTDVARLTFDGGATAIPPIGGVSSFESRYHPYQEGWATERLLPSKPSWSPDALRVATVDQRGLLVVELATGATTTLVTGDVANPAWSPDGEWIAFDSVERVDSIVDLCLYEVPDPKDPLEEARIPNCRERRIFYETTPPALRLIRPDGSETIQVGPGRDPAWSPSGGWLYFSDADGIGRRHLDTGIVERIDDTSGGAEAALSPDGRWLAFTRYDRAVGTRDVWVAELPPPQGD